MTPLKTEPKRNETKKKINNKNTADSSKNWREDSCQNANKGGSRKQHQSRGGGGVPKQNNKQLSQLQQQQKGGGRSSSSYSAAGRNSGRNSIHSAARGRNLSGGTEELYTFHLDGVPNYGENVGEPTFVTPVLGVTYYYDNHYVPQTVPEEVLRGYVKAQIEYYFSPENLQKDFYLRRRMDADGYLPVNLIASFNRVQALTSDMNFIIQAVQDSSVVEIKDGSSFRSKVDPQKWPIAVGQPDPQEPEPTEKNLNPNVPEFVPTFVKKDDEDVDGTDGDDESDENEEDTKKKKKQRNGEVDSQELKQSLANLIATKEAVPSDREEDEWVQVKKKTDRRSQPKDVKPSTVDSSKEELEFNFDEDLESIPQGRQNKFSSM